MKYYNDSIFPIHIPNQSEDQFIRKGYYGGHADAYTPFGENLFYYDVNSLYPFIMKEYEMPGGDPVWHGDLNNRELDALCGFIMAYVTCPDTLDKPFLPYRSKNETLIFPTGKWIGVYYSEELKYARSLGYTVHPLYGYLYEKKKSPFGEFVTSLYSSRLEAKQNKNEALSYVYKILMNSLYGRFGINPQSTKTEICDKTKRDELLHKDGFLRSDQLTDNSYMVTYHINTGTSSLDEWDPPRNAAVQLSAAITACARIYMYPYISRKDCLYTDTDSVVLSSPLHESLISPNKLGGFKLEHKVEKGYFLAPKTYRLDIKKEDGKKHIIKHKGATKSAVDKEWFENLLKDQSFKKDAIIKNFFKIDKKTLTIFSSEILSKVGMKPSTKRNPVKEKVTQVDKEGNTMTEEQTPPIKKCTDFEEPP